jgi:hypothetical protein
MRYSSINTGVHYSTKFLITDSTKKKANQSNVLRTKSPNHKLHVKNSIRKVDTEHRNRPEQSIGNAYMGL